MPECVAVDFRRSFSLFFSSAVAIAALVIAAIAISVSNSNGGTTVAATDVPTVDISLSEFAISPADITVPPGRVRFVVTNTGSLEHNFEIKGVAATRNLKNGETETLEVDLEVGHYDTICNVAGHEGSGMRGMIMVVEGASVGGTASDSPPATMSWQEMDDMMNEGVQKFLRVNGLAEPKIDLKDQGKETADLEPTILPDGTKQFHLTASVVDWEVEPGKMVKAWAYNGVVPGPTIRVNEGDKVQIVLKNELPESTSLHPHGCQVPNAMDGFDPLTQPPITPGSTFTYEWIATGPKVCMYHSHHNAQVQVPNGLLGALYIGQLDLPAGTRVDQEVTMVLNDAGTIGLSLNGRSFPATTGYVVKKGQTMLVHYFNEGLQIHPMHLHQPHGLVIAKDGVELEQPYYSDTINVAPGERFSVLYTFESPGVWAWHCHILTHAETPEGFRYMATAVVVEE
jgi:FtsP/CotA-like multicopper oxidase with cupredoxin domain